MKKLFFLVLLASTGLRSLAVTYTIHVANFAFTPSTINNVHPGDVIMWMWDNGDHTTTSTLLPTNAPSWNSDIDAQTPSFSYQVPNVLGTYHFQCNNHPSMMQGSFTVVSATAVANTSIATVSCSPNPATNNLHVGFGNVSAPVAVSICDLSGREVLSRQYSSKEADIDVSILPIGSYFLKAKELDGAISVQKIEIAR